MTDIGEYAKMKVAELKKLLKNQGLPIAGNKTELIERLQTHITTDNGHDDEEFDEEAILGDEADIDIDKISPHEEESMLLGTNSTSMTPVKKITLKRSEICLSTATTEETEVESAPEEEPQIDSTLEEVVTPPSKKIKLSPETEEPVQLEGKPDKIKLKLAESDDARKVARLARFGNITTTPTSNKKISSAEPADVEMLKKRAERFGEITSKKLTTVEQTEKKRQRQERFGEENVTDKMKQRQERFGKQTTTEKTEIVIKSTNNDIDAEAKKAARAQRFAAA